MLLSDSILTPIILTVKINHGKNDNIDIKSNQESHKITYDIPSKIEWE
jgi:hypothetical protein